MTRLRITSKLIQITPRPLQLFLKRLGFQKILNRIMSKSEAELIFQTTWVDKFKENKDKVLEYWRKYLYLDEIKKICKFTKDTKVLDIGCGISTILHFIEGERYGIDPLAKEYLGMYKYPAGISIREGVGEKIPFPDGYFNVVFCSNVLDHTTDPYQVINEAFRVLTDGGCFILTAHIFNQNFKREPSHPYTFTKKEIFSLVRGRFQVILEEVSSAVGLYAYVVGGPRSDGDELILLLKKTV